MPFLRGISGLEISTRGKQQENPLSLLGQYSDDELDEESSKTLDHVSAENSTAENDEQVKGPISTENEDMESNRSMDLDSEKDNVHDLVDASENLDDLDGGEIVPAVAGDLCKEVVSVDENSLPGTADVQLNGNLISAWKVVLHEESNQYYYWNTLTGETSWVVPDALAQGTELTGEQKTAPDTEGRNSALSGAHQPNSSLDVELDGSTTMHALDQARNVIGAQMEVQNDGNRHEGLEEKKQGLDAKQTEVKFASDAASTLHYKTSSHGDSVPPWESGDALLSNGHTTCADSEKYICYPMVHEDYDTEDDLSSSVLKHSEYLLDKLKSLEGSHIQGHDWLSKYIWEVEIRLSDIKSLLPFGSSLLPFWVHCERRFKELEGAIDNDVSQIFNCAQSREAEPPHKSWEREGNEIDADGNEKRVVGSAFENSPAADDVTLIAVQTDLKDTAANSIVFPADAIDNPAAHSGSGTEGNNGVPEAAELSELTPESALHAEEDEDMDVDMEVEDVVQASASITRDSSAVEFCAPGEQPVQPNAAAGQESFLPPEAFGIPPPPEDDWIPPPPPDNELVPPPPPDDPCEPSYPPPPTYFETVQPLSYTEQYSFSYPGSNFEYYGQAHTEFSTHNVHGHTEGCQVAVPVPPLYYEALANTYPSAAPAVVNPVEPLVYYDLQDGGAHSGPVASGVLSSLLHSESGHETLGSDQIRSVETHADVSSTSLSNAEGGVSVVNGGAEKALLEVPLTVATIQAPVTISAVESAPGSSTTVVGPVSVTAKSTATNVQSKVSHGKKRTVAAVSTLKSNKKVSSLVDKWKAAKEQMHEDEEDEAENAYEILEKKRQREIEEWRAQQIASGEAKDNANFQPLGGDWRERVKRKRAQLNREAIQNSLSSLTDGNQQPDLSEVSRDLPSGWQAYWDESSKQVYYGNTITSETTWTRPTK